jgi:hypothetical protein
LVYFLQKLDQQKNLSLINENELGMFENMWEGKLEKLELKNEHKNIFI